MLNEQTIRNIIAFMERVTVTGKEAFAWVQAYGELQNALIPKPVEPAAPDEP